MITGHDRLDIKCRCNDGFDAGQSAVLSKIIKTFKHEIGLHIVDMLCCFLYNVSKSLSLCFQVPDKKTDIELTGCCTIRAEDMYLDTGFLRMLFFIHLRTDDGCLIGAGQMLG